MSMTKNISTIMHFESLHTISPTSLIKSCKLSSFYQIPVWGSKSDSEPPKSENWHSISSGSIINPTISRLYFCNPSSVYSLIFLIWWLIIALTPPKTRIIDKFSKSNNGVLPDSSKFFLWFSILLKRVIWESLRLQFSSYLD